MGEDHRWCPNCRSEKAATCIYCGLCDRFTEECSDITPCPRHADGKFEPTDDAPSRYRPMIDAMEWDEVIYGEDEWPDEIDDAPMSTLIITYSEARRIADNYLRRLWGYDSDEPE